MSDHRPDHEIELYREGDHYVVLMDLGEYDSDDLDVTWRDNHLHVEAQHVDEEYGRSKVRRRSLSFPKKIDDAGITAAVEGGTLEIRLPIESEAHEKARRIDISD